MVFLQVLLTNGADPSMLDYRLLLDAEEHAYKERQWQAYSMLTTYAAILENEERFSKDLDLKGDFLLDQRNMADLSSNNAIPNHAVINNSKQLVYSDEKGDCSWLEKTLKDIPLDENAVNTVKKHCRKMETYQCSIGQEENSNHNASEEKASDIISASDIIGGSELRGNKVLTTKHYLENKLPWLSSIKPQMEKRKSSKHSCIEAKINSSLSSVDINLMTKPKLNHRSRNKHDEVLSKNTPNSNLGVSEMYLYGYAESSLKSKDPRHGATDSSVCQKSYADNSKELNNNILCKMSRIFLFILKKRHSSYHQLE